MAGPVPRRSLLIAGGALTGGAVLDPRAAWASPSLPDEDGHELWLRYRRVEDARLLADYRRALTHVVVADADPALRSAGEELTAGLSAMLGRAVRRRPEPVGDGALVVGTPGSSRWVAEHIGAREVAGLGPEGYLITRRTVRGADWVFVAAAGERGALYGAFHLLRLLQTRQRIGDLNVRERPVNELRLANHWDNLDRTVERGYAGPSIFHWDELPAVRRRYVDYARALASVGMNGTVVNNVNASARILSADMIEGLVGLAGVLRSWGLTLYLSANYASPMVLGGLDTADPLDDGVRAWWRDKAGEIYRAIPDFGGFLVKANSEGQPGPIDYGRTHADGANLLADAVRPHGGLIMWRAFVHDFDPNTWAHLAYETFAPLDGEFADNVVLQIKNGPIDFQVREPVHPLFGALPRTNSMLELQITQEYTGHTTHLCYLVPQWKEVYGFDTHGNGRGTTVARIVGGDAYGYSHGGVAGVMNLGDDRDWTRHQLAAANTHGYGRLAWNPALSSAAIASEWTRMTFGCDRRTVEEVTDMLLASWRTYEDYTSPLGSGFMIGDGEHFDPSAEGNQPWHRADADGVGFDRTRATGDGDTGMYHPPVRDAYESLARCPDELLLFFQHVPYRHRLHSGSTVIQHIYDTHFSGRENVLTMRERWRALRGRVDASRHRDTLERLDLQADHSTVWRDTLVAYFFETSGILDEQRGWLQVRYSSVTALLAGVPSRMSVTVGNATAARAEAVARLVTPDGWTSGTERISLASREFGSVSLPVRSAGELAAAVPVRADADADDRPVLGGTSALAQMLVAPAGHQCLLALDAGSPSSPVQATYQRLTPADGWDADRGYGWVGDPPQSRDRGDAFDALRRDFVNDTTARTLRLAAPAGVHDTYLLVADNNMSYPTYVRSEGELLARSDVIDGGSFAWIHFQLDGGTAGAEVDLELSGDPGQHWHLNALALVDRDAELPPVVVGEVAVSSPLLGGRAHTLAVEAANTTDDALFVSAGVDVPDGWSAAGTGGDVPAGDVGVIEVSVTPAVGPATAEVIVRLSTTGRDGGDSRRLDVDVVPAGDQVRLALDAGPADSPLLDTYRRLLPADAWNAERGYGWVGDPPQSRDRGSAVDVLRRDFVNDSAPRTLRLAVPPGRHEAHLLVGDVVVMDATRVSSGGTLLAEAPAAPGGTFTWLRVELDGGGTGSTVDLEFSGTPGQHWRLNALVLH
ncbi:alpha-glucuronidase family glycosyl hydrolase [Streptomyces sp. B6B3]|uniref:alpha-glucuronidase family glycosyl hydrolase n=1 Tax=Streptomyces sp. B6B3 TaxID=3153570 RepID=UPI00325CA2AD